MRLTIAEVEADETLPGWMLDVRFPDWSRDTKYAHIAESEFSIALFEVRRGMRDQKAFDKLIATRKANTKARAKKKAERDALPEEVKAAKAQRTKQNQRLARLTSQVTMHTRIVAENAAKWGENHFITDNARRHLQWAKEALDQYVTGSIAAELAKA